VFRTQQILGTSPGQEVHRCVTGGERANQLSVLVTWLGISCHLPFSPTLTVFLPECPPCFCLGVVYESCEPEHLNETPFVYVMTLCQFHKFCTVDWCLSDDAMKAVSSVLGI
jgi:hypothetical protein